MNYKELIEKEIDIVIKEKLEPEMLWFNVKKELRTKTIPDEIIEKSGVVYGKRFVARKKIPNGYTDAWGIKKEYDECIVENNCLNQEVEFYLLNDDETKKFLQEINKYLELDISDFKGHILGAIFPIGAKNNTENEKWNNYLKK